MTEQELLDNAKALQEHRHTRGVLSKFLTERERSDGPSLFISNKIFIRKSHGNSVYLSPENTKLLILIADSLVQSELEEVNKKIKGLLGENKDDNN